MLGCDPGDQDAILAFQQFGRYLKDLLRGFARAENDLWKTFAQRPMRVHLGEPEVGQRRGLERAHNGIATDASRAKLFKQFDGFLRGHGRPRCHTIGTGSRRKNLSDDGDAETDGADSGRDTRG